MEKKALQINKNVSDTTMATEICGKEMDLSCCVSCSIVWQALPFDHPNLPVSCPIIKWLYNEIRQRSDCLDKIFFHWGTATKASFMLNFLGCLF